MDFILKNVDKELYKLFIVFASNDFRAFISWPEMISTEKPFVTINIYLQCSIH